MFQCIKCNKEFKTKQNLKNHLNKKIPCDRKLECNRCKKIFDTNQHLKQHLNRKTSCQVIELQQENALLKKDNEILTLKLENIELKYNNQLINTINSNNNNNTINSNNNIVINNFGNENLEHITKKLLEKEILKIANKSWDECFQKQLEYENIKYKMIDIKLIDIHILLTKLIYFSKKENDTIKKESNRYYIHDNEWKEISFDDLNLKILNKHQQVLVELKSSKLLTDNKFIKVIENYFGSDEEYNLKIQAGKIEFILPKRKFEIISKLLDHELENKNLDINHNNFIL